MSLQTAIAIFNEANSTPDTLNRRPQNAQTSETLTPEEETPLTAQDMAENTVTTTAQGTQPQKQEPNINAIIARLSKNYDKNTDIPAPVRIGIFPRGFVSILGGKAGVGKSWQIIRWMRDLSIGGDVFGGVAIAQPPRKCLLFAGELPKKEMERRCRLLEKGDGIERNYNNFVIVDNKEAERAKISLLLDTKDGQNNIRSFLNYHSPEIVFFDSLISFFEGDEKNSKDVNPLLEFLERIADENNMAVVLVHHIRKRLPREQINPLDIDDFIGSNSLSRKGGFLFSVENISDTQKIMTREAKSWLRKTNPFTYTLTKGFYGGLVMDIQPDAEDFSRQFADTKGTKKNPTATASNAEATLATIKAILRARGNKPILIKELREILEIPNTKKEADELALIVKRACDAKKLKRVGRGIYALPETDNETDNENYELDFTDEAGEAESEN